MSDYQLNFAYDPRVTSLHLGERKYTTPSRAIGELVANGFDAGASRVAVSVVRNDLGGDEAVIVSDDGCGMTPAVIRSRFGHVGVAPDTETESKFAKFGVGRFAVHRVGSHATWLTVSVSAGQNVRSTLILSSEEPDTVRVSEQATSSEETGTEVRISNLIEPDTIGLHPNRLLADLTAQFCSFLLGHPEKELIVQGKPADVDALVEARSAEYLEVAGVQAELTHLVFKATLDRSRFAEQVLFTSKGRTVATRQPSFALAPQYLAVVEWPELEGVLSSNREGLIDLNSDFGELESRTFGAVREFQKSLRNAHTRMFLKEARERDYYPFKGPPKTAVQRSEQVLYDSVLSEVNQQVNVEGMTQRQQAVLFQLLRRALENEDLLEILGELIQVPDQQLARFREALSRTTMDSIIRLSAEVTDRLVYLDQLHNLVYGSDSRFVLERAHLHKLLEGETWIFGEVFHLASSDQSFRTVIARHREQAGLDPVGVGDLDSVSGLAQIPDLFLAADKEFSQTPKHRRLLVEIKAPHIPIGKKELDQIQRYADVLLESSQFDGSSSEWDLYLVSSGIEASVERRRVAPDRPFGMLDRTDKLRVWVFRWSEIVEKCRDELLFVRKHLERKATDFGLDYWAERFPEIVEGIESRRDRAKLRLEK